MHDAGKVIFGNPMYARLDLMRQLDGFYDEHGQHPNSINTCSILAVHKPYIAWTWELPEIQKDPDAYFQRHLHLGAFLTAPVPGNDHTVLPDAKLDQLFFDYGPLLDALRGKRWVLLPHVVRVEGDKAMANVFESPAAMSCRSCSAEKKPRRKSCCKVCRRCPAKTVFASKPSSPAGRSRSTDGVAKGKLLRINVPLKRGCAMLLLTHTWMSPSLAFFHDAVKIELGTRLEGVELHYTLDGGEPTAQSPVYAKPVELQQTTVVKAAAFLGDQKIGQTLEHRYVTIHADAK